ncbi:hypothetical protein ABGV40_03885 [Paenibacillus amylolyticus]|uniref:hypothetical protein n=1 Tax=Paenibacillus amylolyticus TaxID=1451 RepID=UPI0032428E35
MTSNIPFFTYFRAKALEVPYKMIIKDQTLTEGTEKTEEAKRSPLSTDFPILEGIQKNPGITAIRSCSVTAVTQLIAPCSSYIIATTCAFCDPP